MYCTLLSADVRKWKCTKVYMFVIQLIKFHWGNFHFPFFVTTATKRCQGPQGVQVGKSSIGKMVLGSRGIMESLDTAWHRFGVVVTGKWKRPDGTPWCAPRKRKSKLESSKNWSPLGGEYWFLGDCNFYGTSVWWWWCDWNSDELFFCLAIKDVNTYTCESRGFFIQLPFGSNPPWLWFQDGWYFPFQARRHWSCDREQRESPGQRDRGLPRGRHVVDGKRLSEDGQPAAGKRFWRACPLISYSYLGCHSRFRRLGRIYLLL